MVEHMTLVFGIFDSKSENIYTFAVTSTNILTQFKTIVTKPIM